MIRALLVGAVMWVLARLRLCLAGIDEAEVQRMLVRRLRWVVLSGGGAAFLVVVGGMLAAQLAGVEPLPYRRPHPELVAYAGAVLLALAALALWRYGESMARRARADRELAPDVLRGTVVIILSAREGGLPVLIRRQDGRLRWLTGSAAALRPVRGRLARMSRRGYRMSIVVVFHRRSRVVKEVAGMAVEAVDAVWREAPDAVPDPI